MTPCRGLVGDRCRGSHPRQYIPDSIMESQVFHILNRGVEKRKVFLTEEDYLRFVNNLRDFNDKKATILSYYRRSKPNSRITLVGDRIADKLVDILCWCLMPNHFHSLAQEKLDRGASKFTKKITGGYTTYFNIKNKRSGVLFQGRSKIIRVKRDPHFFYLPFYIFSNPIELIEPHWKEQGIRDLDKVISFLENYKYSAFSDLTGKENFPSVINKNLFYELFDTNPEKFKKDFIDWLKDYRGRGFENFGD